MIKIILTTTFFVITSLINAQTPTFSWAKNMGGYYGLATGQSVGVDGAGNVYNTGYFEGRVDFDPGVGTFYLTSAGLNDVFITKTSASGSFIWAKKFGGILDDRGNSIAVNGSDDIWVAGYFNDVVDFDPGAAVFNLTSAGGMDIFILKLDASGSLTWVRQFGDTYDDIANAVAIDAMDNVYTTGAFAGNVDFDPGAGSFSLNTGGSTANAFISKLSPGGNYGFAKQIAGGVSSIHSITIDPSGYIYSTGLFSYTNDFDPGTGVYNLTSAGFHDIFISKLNANGNFMWAKQLGESQSEKVLDINTDASGNVYIIGEFMDTVDFDPGPAVFNLISDTNYDIYICKLNASGNFIWANKIGGGTNTSEHANSIVSDGAGNIYIAGDFHGTQDFDPGPGTFNLTVNAYGAFILKLNTAGNFVWVKALEGSRFVVGNSIAINASGNIHTTGAFTEICDFDPGASTYNLIGSGGSMGNIMFVSKLDASGNFLWANSAGVGASVIPRSMTTDQAGNVYTTGDFIGIIDFDPGPGIVTLRTATTDIEGDVFVTKCNSAGNLIWARKLGGLAEDQATSITVDASGNVYTVGNFKGTADFNPGIGIFNLTSSLTNPQVFISKLNATGNFIWAKTLGTNKDIYSIALDASGNLFTAGRSFPGTNSHQIYLNKLDPSGNLIWTKTYGGLSDDLANSIATDASGNIYFTGYFTGTVDFDPGTGIFNMTAISNQDVFVSKFDGSGNFIWAKMMGGPGNCTGYSIALDGSGKIHIAGTFSQTADFDPGPGIFNLTTTGTNEVFITKLDNSGNFTWAKKFTGTATVRTIAVDVPGNVYTTGTFGNTDFDPGSGTFNLTSVGLGDVYISKLDASGNFIWALQIGNEKAEQVFGLALDGLANVYTSGIFYQTVDFNPGVGISYLSATGSPDLYIHKISQCSPPQAIITAAGPTTFCEGGSVTLNANTGAGLTYQWIKNGVSVPGAISANYVATTSGSYTVFVSNSTPCSETSNTIVVNVPCIPIDPSEERMFLSSPEDINVFPNPSKGKFIIESPPGQLRIFSAFGELVLSIHLSKDENTFDLSQFSDGIYLLNLRTEESSFTKKIILNH